MQHRGVIMDRRNARVRALVTVAAGALLMSAIAAAQSPGPVNGQDVGFVETDLVTNVPSLVDSNGIVHTPGPCGAVVPQCVDSNLGVHACALAALGALTVVDSGQRQP
jgi:hypothetical protein